MTSTMAKIIFCMSLALPLVSCSGGDSNEPAASPPASIATASAQFEWDPNTETDLAGYKVYKGTSSVNTARPSQPCRQAAPATKQTDSKKAVRTSSW